MQHIEIYYKTWCPYSQRALALLDAKGVSYTGIDVTEDPVREQEMIARARSHTVPQIFIDDQPIGGFDDLAALDAAGELDALLGLAGQRAA
jgi:GrxC family glutaredoxin